MPYTTIYGWNYQTHRNNLGAPRRIRAGRRAGAVLVYFALILTVLLGVCAYVIDEGQWFIRKADMQKAADASAMSGAALLASDDVNRVTQATLSAQNYARDNGYEDGKTGIAVTSTINPTTFVVKISKPERTFFGGIFGINNANINVQATAYYLRATSVLVPITGRNYGINDGPINIGIYGPEQISARGDRYSAKYKNVNGVVTGNPDYRSEGYNFFVSLPSDAAFGDTANLQVYDPDSYDSGSDATAGNKRWDESGKEQYGPSGNGFARIGSNASTVTRYTIYSDNGTPYDNSDDTKISSRDYGNDASTDKKWDNSFNLQIRTLKALRPDKDVNVRLQVQTISGGNENGFNIRVARPQDTDATFKNGGNGTNVSAIGTLPVNFGDSGSGKVALGAVPAGADTVIVKHFDSDVGVVKGSTILYNDGTKDYNGNPLLAAEADDKEEIDTFKLGAGYSGGNWTATYAAGASDNTTWDLSYSGPPTGNQREIRLVG